MEHSIAEKPPIKQNETVHKNTTVCYHCGAECEEEMWLDEKPFCCYGCKTVFEILSANDLCEYYNLETQPGNQLNFVSDETFAADFSRISFDVPAIQLYRVSGY